MTDTQWPRFEVFEQERPGQPHRNAGAVHAPDPEMALQNARDVFVRRPETHSLWVVPAAQILSRTAEELAAGAPAPVAQPSGSADAPYLVFQKQTQRQGETFVVYVGDVHAPDPETALARALAQYSASPVYVWWVVPAAAVTRSDPGEADALFGTARDKPFRLPKSYPVHSQMRAVLADAAPPAPQEREN